MTDFHWNEAKKKFFEKRNFDDYPALVSSPKQHLPKDMQHSVRKTEEYF